MSELGCNGQEKVLCVRELRLNGDTLEQRLLILSNGVESEEWRSVPQVQPQPLENRDNQNTDWSEIDWNLSTGELARRTGYSIGYVSQMRSKHGFPKPLLGSRTIHSRKKLVSEEMISKADWLNDNDVEIARQWHCSKEFVRQIRESRQLPVCRFKHQRLSLAQKPLAIWIWDHAQELNGKNIEDAVDMLPGTHPRYIARYLLKRSGITFDMTTKHGHRGPYNARDINWELPNKMLSLVWGFREFKVANLRCRYQKPTSRWICTGGRRPDDEAFESALRAEVEKAKAQGKQVDESIFNYGLEVAP